MLPAYETQKMFRSLFIWPNDMQLLSTANAIKTANWNKLNGILDGIDGFGVSINFMTSDNLQHSQQKD